MAAISNLRVVDLFAGAGGFSTGAEMAGLDVVWASNHWQVAVETHSLNHPNAQHACQDLQQMDWRNLPGHDAMLASPCCQGHSPARGKANGNPQHDASRSTAWAPVAAAEYHRPYLFVIENVVGFLKWVLYPAWCSAMEALGYCLTPMIVDAADHGVPQNRERLFIVGVRAKHPLMIHLRKVEHVPASSFIDFNAGSWTKIADKVPNTQRRAANGRRTFGDRFIMPYYGGGSGLTGRSLSRPIGTITTRDRWGVVDGDRMRMLSVAEALAAMSFPPRYIVPAAPKLAMHMIGNAVAPLAARDVLTAMLEAA